MTLNQELGRLRVAIAKLLRDLADRIEPRPRIRTKLYFPRQGEPVRPLPDYLLDWPGKAEGKPKPPIIWLDQKPAQREGCRRQLAPGQWWSFCGETDMGQTLPALCRECGGDLELQR